MPNTTIVSFKVAPEHYAVLRAMAMSQGKSLSELVREAVERALKLDAQTKRFAAFLAKATPEEA